MRNKDAEHAASHHQYREADGLLKVQRPAGGKKLNGKEGRQEREVPAEHLAKREAHGGGKGDPEGEPMALAGIISLYRLGGGAN